jgi:hypothetical protein
MTRFRPLGFALLAAMLFPAVGRANGQDPKVAAAAAKMRRAVHRAIQRGEPRPLGMLVKGADGQSVAVLPVSTHVGATAEQRAAAARSFAHHTDFEIHAEEPRQWGHSPALLQNVKSRGLVTTAPVDERARSMRPRQGMMHDRIVDEKEWDAENAARNTEMRAGGRRGGSSRLGPAVDTF